MATRSLTSKSFGKHLFLSVGTVFILFAVSFSIYQYHRERQFKIDILDARLRTYCYEMVRDIGEDSLTSPRAVESYIAAHPIDSLRISIINTAGQVLVDSDMPAEAIGDNHLGRKEVAHALRYGEGYDIKRTSSSTHHTYFYSATRFGSSIVRVAVPYSTALTRSLQTDNAYIVFALLLTLLLGVVLYGSTARIAKHIRYLRDFASGAARGEHISHALERALPDDELGEICHTITALYWQLRSSEEDKTRLKRQLTQNAAHELKTPAAAIHGYLESILDHPEMPAAQRQHFLEQCFAQSERQCRLLRDMSTLMLLDTSHAAADVPPHFCRERVDIAELIHALLEEVAPALSSKGLTPVLQMPAEITILGDRSLLYSLFRNIIDNTLAYAVGADTLTLACTPQDDGTYAFTISDNGEGVAAEHLPHLFERFYRVDKGRSRKTGGTGLGLAIVKNVVLLHGGTIAATATDGGGLTIRFTLTRQL